MSTDERMLEVGLGERSYSVHIGSGTIARAGDVVAGEGARRAVVVTNGTDQLRDGTVGVAYEAGVFAGGVTMAVGMLVHEASVLLVIVNAMRLLRRPGQPRSTTSNSSRSAPVATGAGRPPCSAA